MSETDILSILKRKCGIAEHIKAYDADIKDYMQAARIDMSIAGICKEVYASDNEYVLNCISCYIKMYLGDDRTDTAKYSKLYESMKIRISIANESLLADVSETDTSNKTGEGEV